MLADFDSYAILATHSPQILQEVPARAIRIIERDGGFPSVRPYPLESFSANLEEITELAFGMEERDKNYTHILKDCAQTLGGEWLDKESDGVFMTRLGLAPHALLRGLRKSRRNDEES